MLNFKRIKALLLALVLSLSLTACSEEVANAIFDEVIVIAVSDALKVPVKFVGIGEGIDDLKVFDKKEFVGSLFSKDDIV